MLRFMIDSGTALNNPFQFNERLKSYMGEKTDSFLSDCQKLAISIMTAYSDLSLVEDKLKWNIENNPEENKKISNLLFKVNEIKESIIGARSEKVFNGYMNNFVLETKQCFGNSQGIIDFNETNINNNQRVYH